MLFKVKALAESRRVQLQLDAVDAVDAAAQARLQGLTVIAVQPGRPGLMPTVFSQRSRFPLNLFSRELLALLGSGLSLIEALQALEEKEARPEYRAILSEVLRRLYDGESFSAAIAHQPACFPALYVAMVRASERTSDLPQALKRYVAYQEQLEFVRKKVIAASVYPLLLLVVGAMVALFLLGYVTPRFSALYADNLAALPFASRVLMQWGGLVAEHAFEAGILVLAGFAGLAHLATLPRVRVGFGRLLWRLPSLGERLRIFHLSRFYRTVGMLLDGGIPAVSALEMAAGLLHPELRDRLAAAATGIREGKSISQSMERAGLTTPVALRMLRVGEKSGRMGEMMESAAAFHDEETSRFVEWFTRLFEPILMAFIGLIIGLIVVLLYLPIFELAGSLE